jgi:hypothetical protein
MKKIFTLMVAALAAFSWTAQEAHAAELLVADGSATNEKCPIESYNNDCYVHHQLIYPASLLEGMKGSTVSALTFYVNTVAGKTIDGVYNVGLAVVEDDHFDGGAYGTSYSYNEAALTAVYQGVIDGSQETVTLTFSTPFAYTEGNLLVDIRTETKGANAKDAVFAGMETEAIQSVRAFYMLNMPSQPTGGDAFLPKTTFTYTENNATGVEKVQSDKVQSTKVFENGVLVIEHNGMKYNAQGSVVK